SRGVLDAIVITRAAAGRRLGLQGAETCFDCLECLREHPLDAVEYVGPGGRQRRLAGRGRWHRIGNSRVCDSRGHHALVPYWNKTNLQLRLLAASCRKRCSSPSTSSRIDELIDALCSFLSSGQPV